MADLVLTAPVLEKTRREIDQALIKAGAHMVLLVDEAGNIVTSCGKDSSVIDTTSLAALAAANFGATCQIAQLIGEDDFSLLFHKGKKDSVHFTRIEPDFILITVFGEQVSLGLIRVRVGELARTLEKILGF
ncbi:MAG TPA: roadblock/LC7 domain-containing protein [Thermodesulfobacteriaceae bacterium]|nr:roadblock/LC7 domain-containing protein [Thermodesulfobacteriaceae bacterium]